MYCIGIKLRPYCTLIQYSTAELFNGQTHEFVLPCVFWDVRDRNCFSVVIVKYEIMLLILITSAVRVPDIDFIPIVINLVNMIVLLILVMTMILFEATFYQL